MTLYVSIETYITVSIMRAQMLTWFLVDEIEVLGEIQRNRHVSTSLETWNGQNTANVTLIADGSGKFEVNGIPLHKFFTVNFSNLF